MCILPYSKVRGRGSGRKKRAREGWGERGIRTREKKQSRFSVVSLSIALHGGTAGVWLVYRLPCNPLRTVYVHSKKYIHSCEINLLFICGRARPTASPTYYGYTGLWALWARPRAQGSLTLLLYTALQLGYGYGARACVAISRVLSWIALHLVRVWFACGHRARPRASRWLGRGLRAH